MMVVSFLSAVTFLTLGVLMWKYEAINLLAGVDVKNVVDSKKLSKLSGLSMLMLGLLLAIETILIYQNILLGSSAIFTVVATIIFGTIVIALIVGKHS